MADPIRAALASDGPAVPESREPASVMGEPSDIEQVAQQVFEAMRFSGATSPAPPEWVSGGNSLMQDHARDVARALLARWGHQPAPLVAGAPGPSMEDVGPLIAWLTEQACQAADANQPADAGMLTWAAQVIGERVNEDAPVAGEVAELSEGLPGAADIDFEFVVFDADYCTQAGGVAPTYAQALSEGQRYLAQYQQDGRPYTLELRRVEVLHPGALPQGEV